MRRMTNVSDDFLIDFDLNNPGNFKITPKKSPTNVEGLIKGRIIFSIPEEYRSLTSVNQLLKYSYQKQKRIKLKTLLFETSVGGKVIEAIETIGDIEGPFAALEFTTEESVELFLHSRLGQESVAGEVEIIPSEFPPPINVVVETGDMSASLSNIDLGLEEIDENSGQVKFILSNQNQINSHIYLRLSITFNAIGDQNYTMAQPDISIRVKDHACAYHYFLVARFFAEMSKNNNISVREASTGKQVMLGSGVNLSTEVDFNESVVFWKTVLDVQKLYGCEFVIPEIITYNDKSKLQELQNIGTAGIIRSATEGTLNANIKFDSKASLAKFIDDCADKNFLLSLKEAKTSIAVLGCDIDLGPKLYIWTKVKLVNADCLKSISNAGVMGEIAVDLELQSVEEGQHLEVYPQFYGSEKIEEVLSREGLGTIEVGLITN